MTKRCVLFFLCILLLLTACSSETTIPDRKQLSQEYKTEEAKNYILFTLNVHDWVFPEQSAETVLKTIEIHEKYNIP